MKTLQEREAMTSNQTGGSVLEQIITEDDFSNEESCQWETCREPATHWLICPMCAAREFLCNAHAVMIQNAKVGEVVVFNCSCDHKVLRVKCSVEPK